MRLSILVVAALSVGTATAQQHPTSDYDEFLRKGQSRYEAFRQEGERKYESFRDSANAAYEDFMRKPWKPIKFNPPKPKPRIKEPKPDPVTIKDEDIQRRKSNVVKIDTVVKPQPKPKPMPPEPIKPKPTPTPVKKLKIAFYGTPIEVSDAGLAGFHLNGASEASFADGWNKMRNSGIDNLIADCLSARDTHQLPDWGYIKLLDKAAALYATPSTNEHALIHGYMLHQSGFKVRYAIDGNNRLHMLFGTDGIIYGCSGYVIDGTSFYAYTEPTTTMACLCAFDYPKSKNMRLQIDKAPLLDYAAATPRKMTAHFHPELTVNITVNRNLCDFYTDYPNASPDKSPYSKWAIHGNTPASREVREQLYPSLREAVKGKTQLQAVTILLNLAETFPYGYDDQIWGHDRAFWMDESWNYPYSDCEDHAINFTRMVRDIIGLDAVLIFYPGHLSAAIAFIGEQPSGDYVVYAGKKYTVCDATCQYGPVGYTAGGYDNSQAILIPLER